MEPEFLFRGYTGSKSYEELLEEETQYIIESSQIDFEEEEKQLENSRDAPKPKTRYNRPPVY